MIDNYVITWLWNEKFPKRKSCDNNHPEHYPGQFDLQRNVPPSQAPTWSRGSFSPYALVFLRTCLPTHLFPYTLVFLRTWLFMMARKDGKKRWQGRMITSLFTHSTSYCYVCILAVGIYLKLSTCWSMQFIILNCHSMWQGSWNCRLDPIDNSPLCGSQSHHQYWPE